MIPSPFIVTLVIRSLLILPFPHTYFQPDEFYQAFEPAHRHVFGFGFLTWEWRDLPTAGDDTWWHRTIIGGRMRGWIWPGIFVAVYKLLQSLCLDHTDLIVMAPRCVGVLVASLTDLYTYRLSAKVLGSGGSAAALFLSLTSLFNAHLLPRALSTSPETLLTTMALYYFPLPVPSSTSTSVNVPAAAMKHTTISSTTDTIVDKLNYVVMDRNPPFVVEPKQYVINPRRTLTNRRHKDNFALSVCLAMTALCIRPTTLSLWAFLGADLVWRMWRTKGLLGTLGIMTTAAVAR
ncbi:hypothetical protein IAR55_006481 [Kwoniella newhampshirensis]|uniref:Mannosyltransferase n=1 Tax=Kwoniella newhampshirensis TaxID=1651941 RepID=A0AAW0YU40_9TREE